jgi:hypothetical protein
MKKRLEETKARGESPVGKGNERGQMRKQEKTCQQKRISSE